MAPLEPPPLRRLRLLPIVAIDGPVASGKTAVGREMARRLGWQMLDTGIMYRALTWLALQRGLDLLDPAALTELARTTVITIADPPPGSDESASIFVDGVDATPHLREPRVDEGVSIVAAVAGVRGHMVEQQRAIAQQTHVVMVGRDICTVVAPDAAVKAYLDATPEVRAGRRAAQMRAQGRDADETRVLADLKRRDALDAGRATSPLRVDAGAETIDTSGLTLEEVVAHLVALVRERIPLPADQ